MNKVYEIINTQIIEKLEAGVIPWHKSWTAGVCKNCVTQKPYRGFNIFRLGMEEYENPNWGTYKQFRNLGGSVNKGQKSTMIIFWNIKKIQNKEGKEETIPILRYYNVFNVEQTTMCDDEQFKIIRNDNHKIEKCESIIDNYVGKPVIVSKDSSRAYYHDEKDLINIPNISLFDSSEEFYSTLFHECIHSTGRHTRLGRFEEDEKPDSKNPKYWEEEIIAELGASYLGGMTGISYSVLNNSVSYINAYLQLLKNDQRAFIRACSAAQKAVEHIQGVETT